MLTTYITPIIEAARSRIGILYGLTVHSAQDTEQECLHPAVTQSIANYNNRYRLSVLSDPGNNDSLVYWY